MSFGVVVLSHGSLKRVTFPQTPRIPNLFDRFCKDQDILHTENIKKNFTTTLSETNRNINYFTYYLQCCSIKKVNTTQSEWLNFLRFKTPASVLNLHSYILFIFHFEFRYSNCSITFDFYYTAINAPDIITFKTGHLSVRIILISTTLYFCLELIIEQKQTRRQRKLAHFIIKVEWVRHDPVTFSKTNMYEKNIVPMPKVFVGPRRLPFLPSNDHFDYRQKSWMSS